MRELDIKKNKWYALKKLKWYLQSQRGIKAFDVSEEANFIIFAWTSMYFIIKVIFKEYKLIKWVCIEKALNPYSTYYKENIN